MYSYRDLYPNFSMAPSVREMTAPEGPEQKYYTQNNIPTAPDAAAKAKMPSIGLALAVIVGVIFLLHL